MYCDIVSLLVIIIMFTGICMVYDIHESMNVNNDDNKSRKWTDISSLFRILEYLRIGNYKCISESTNIGLLSCIHEARFSYSFNNLYTPACLY